MKISTALKQWCDECQRATPNKTCSCDVRGAVFCAVCHKCDDENHWE